jgi:pimeloyl-ACP methyl ester carboxylesterase
MITKKCKGSPDFELGKGHNREVVYHCAHPSQNEKQKIKGIVFFISCFGLEDEYIKNWIHKAADEFGLLAVAVEYHCFRSRPENGAQIQIPEDIQQRLHFYFQKYRIMHHDDFDRAMRQLGDALPEPVRMDGVKLMPANDEYQNFGLMQALDHLYVLDDLIKSNIDVDWNNIILFGSSHGGYIAHMIAKLAPNTPRLIIDNSSYVSPPPQYMGQGSEYAIGVGKLTLGCSTLNPWQRSYPYDSTYYNLHHQLIRDTAYPVHLRVRGHHETPERRQIQVEAYQSAENDLISFPADKRNQQLMQCKNGRDYQLHLIQHHDLGGIFKTMSHGMEASLWDLFCLSMGMEKKQGWEIKSTVLDLESKNVLIFPCITADYTVQHGGELPVKIKIDQRRHL